MVRNNGSNSPERRELEDLIAQVSVIHSEMLEAEAAFNENSDLVHHSHRASAKNLLHYLTLRQRDIRELQERLAYLGLSSLGRTESNVLASVNAVLAVLCEISHLNPIPGVTLGSESSFVRGKKLLRAHTEALLGTRPEGRDVRIMVTMPSSAVDDYHLVKQLLKHGMDCMRINCAYDDNDAWAGMIRNLKRAREETGKRCRVLMDLAGPKLRLGQISGESDVIKWRPRRDESGKVKHPAHIWLTDAESPQPPPGSVDAFLPVPGEFLSRLNTGDVIKFFDARGSSRSMTISKRIDNGRLAESYQTAYVASGSVLQVTRYHPSINGTDVARVGELRAQTQSIFLSRGDALILTRSLEPGRGAIFDQRGKLLSPARIGVTLPEIFMDVRPGESIWLDDGKIGGVIKAVDEEQIEVEITQARDRGERLSGDKGINLPDSRLRLPALTEKDLRDLTFIARHADLVGYSFVRTEADVYDLQSRLADLGGDGLGIVLKIETRKAFEQLPMLLLAAMRSPCCGVMIARGDLAVECGFERLAEVQEEILWIAEAAHMPVIWATQVLERLAKQGMATRAEITDAAMGERAECVMLNKGPYILSALRTLDDILRRMQSHQNKKRAKLRQLSLADRFSAGVWARAYRSSSEKGSKVC